ncbi:hypothetical protein [Sulfurimonas sp.]|uniref:hypothetical protein n=1 Tax=Sulfurimonas sp. TaxID=2022749 RepID=UPI0025DFCAE0|nr:hypothetical protein [Sulfurimonas sp.]
MLRLFGRFSIVLLLATSILNAQSFEDFKKSNAKSFKKYKDSRDSTFNKYLKEQWEAYNVYKGTPLYSKPKPRSISPAEPKQIKSVGPKVSIIIKRVEPVKEKVTTPKVKKKTTPVQEPKKDIVITKIKPIIVQEKKDEMPPRDIAFNYFGSELGFDISDGLKQAKFYPQNQKGIRNFFDNAASSDYKNLISEIKSISKSMKLNDWGVYLLVLDISKKVHMNHDNANLLSWFIFNKLGYAVKVGLAKNRVVLMHYSNKIIYSTPNYKFSNKKFYVVSKYSKSSVGRLYSYKQDYPDAKKPLDLSLKTLPNLSKDIRKKTLSFEENGKTYKVTFDYNQNLIDFMATYPQADYETYFNSPLETMTYNSIARDLKKYVDGKKAGDAMNFVLHFVQKSFKYERDNQQFGREKVMFANETLYFNKSDCEDRAILFSYLIKELFGVGVVGVKYKDHMATALYVPMSGDSIKAGQRKLVLADPTYINASIGQSMPKYKSIIPDSFVVVKG